MTPALLVLVADSLCRPVGPQGNAHPCRAGTADLNA
jgi:hypothetical protein